MVTKGSNELRKKGSEEESKTNKTTKNRLEGQKRKEEAVIRMKKLTFILCL